MVDIGQIKAGVGTDRANIRYADVCFKPPSSGDTWLTLLFKVNGDGMRFNFPIIRK